MFLNKTFVNLVSFVFYWPCKLFNYKMWCIAVCVLELYSFWKRDFFFPLQIRQTMMFLKQKKYFPVSLLRNTWFSSAAFLFLAATVWKMTDFTHTIIIHFPHHLPSLQANKHIPLPARQIQSMIILQLLDPTSSTSISTRVAVVRCQVTKLRKMPFLPSC